MSLVGPRPLRPSEVEAYELWHRGRSTPPGRPPSLGDLDATVLRSSQTQASSAIRCDSTAGTKRRRRYRSQ
jgi:lipopolysaccharide/colanic/teichoic acid biosynthesis glycosyltransferase